MFHMQRQRKLPEEHARFYAAEISLALNFLHEKVSESFDVFTATLESLIFIFRE